MEIVEENESKFINFLREQWKTGVHGENQTFQYANRQYAIEKQQQNPSASGNVDLILSGDLSEGIYFNITEGTDNMAIEFYSRDEKAEGLTEKYGELIWEYNDQTKDKVVGLVLKSFRDYLDI